MQTDLLSTSAALSPTATFDSAPSIVLYMYHNMTLNVWTSVERVMFHVTVACCNSRWPVSFVNKLLTVEHFASLSMQIFTVDEKCFGSMVHHKTTEA